MVSECYSPQLVDRIKVALETAPCISFNVICLVMCHTGGYIHGIPQEIITSQDVRNALDYMAMDGYMRWPIKSYSGAQLVATYFYRVPRTPAEKSDLLACMRDFIDIP